MAGLQRQTRDCKYRYSRNVGKGKKDLIKKEKKEEF
jgi:hypothetical protein